MNTTRAKDFTQWYQEVVDIADLAENSTVRGCMVIKPWGMGTWERVQRLLDDKIKETGHDNCYFPLFVPVSLFLKEAAHVEGFAKEMALVTHTRLKIVDGQVKLEGQLEEPLVVRPTSETIIAESFAQWIHSYRDLPVLVNQWANVVRWEMRPRLFLRTTEFLWQEGHTAHADAAEAEAEAAKMLEVYRALMEDHLALPVITGEKTPQERFPGAVATYSLEAFLQDGKALQAGTSHYLGQDFAKAAKIQFQDKDGQLHYVHTTSWGVSTRLIGAVIMTHGDDDGLRLPPAIAPSQIVIVPIHREEGDKAPVTAFCEQLAARLRAQVFQGEPLRVKVDVRDRKAQDKRWEWVKKGAPLVVEVGPRDLAKGEVCWISRLEIGKKNFEAADAFVAGAGERLQAMQAALLAQAKAFRDANIRTDIKDFAAFKGYFSKKAAYLAEGAPGWVRAHWCGDEDSLKVLDEMAVTIRNIPSDQKGPGVCVLTGKPAEKEVYFARAY
ncbi:MAG TPA: proline--tRNA ligase [bacterium]|nr:proline--tRNA ligase [bacterium]